MSSKLRRINRKLALHIKEFQTYSIQFARNDDDPRNVKVRRLNMLQRHRADVLIAKAQRKGEDAIHALSARWGNMKAKYFMVQK